MNEKTETKYCAGNSVCDGLRFACEALYAVMPRDVAQKVGEFEKNLWGGVRWFADKNIGWIDEALKGGDRLREEWQRRSGGQPHVTEEPPGTA
ncbi:MAG: hypothetical protein H0T63_03760 [Pyrinomonadaceae bacterium]|nr:hypothetical protein [Pyrinomonadaceae bacterium]MDQ3584588.1 hypothetical protein [Acidobacteriota bacterium]